MWDLHLVPNIVFDNIMERLWVVQNERGNIDRGE
jgi:hypothetical protein